MKIKPRKYNKYLYVYNKYYKQINNMINLLLIIIKAHKEKLNNLY